MGHYDVYYHLITCVFKISTRELSHVYVFSTSFDTLLSSYVQVPATPLPSRYERLKSDAAPNLNSKVDSKSPGNDTISFDPRSIRRSFALSSLTDSESAPEEHSPLEEADTEAKKVALPEFTIHYDKLIIAVGAYAQSQSPFSK